MRLHHFLILGVLSIASAALTACGGEGSGSASAMGMTSAKPGGSTSAAATTAMPSATAMASATASATAAPTAAAVAGLAAGEIVAASCDTIEKDSECFEVVVKSEADKAKTLDLMKKMCKGKVAETACPADKIVETCRVGKDMIGHYSSEGPKKYTADVAKKECEKGHGHPVP